MQRDDQQWSSYYNPFSNPGERESNTSQYHSKEGFTKPTSHVQMPESIVYVNHANMDPTRRAACTGTRIPSNGQEVLPTESGAGFHHFPRPISCPEHQVQRTRPNKEHGNPRRTEIPDTMLTLSLDIRASGAGPQELSHSTHRSCLGSSRTITEVGARRSWHGFSRVG